MFAMGQATITLLYWANKEQKLKEKVINAAKELYLGYCWINIRDGAYP